MQLREDAAQKWADAQRLKYFDHTYVLDPETNTLAGCFYLSYVLRRYSQTDNPFAFALADYNAGRGNVLRWIGSNAATAARTNSRAFLAAITFPGTRAYVTEILERRAQYEGDFGADDWPGHR
jgi:soluble lytic murein transglycosylase